jgi:hypothetical protein
MQKAGRHCRGPQQGGARRWYNYCSGTTPTWSPGMESHCRGRRARARGGGVAAARERRQRGVGGCIRPEDAANHLILFRDICIPYTTSQYSFSFLDARNGCESSLEILGQPKSLDDRIMVRSGLRGHQKSMDIIMKHLCFLSAAYGAG